MLRLQEKKTFSIKMQKEQFNVYKLCNSIQTATLNIKCMFCQNWEIEDEYHYWPMETLISAKTM